MTNPVDIPAAFGLPPLPSTSPDTIAALMWAREVMQKHQTTTYAVTDPNGIEELKPVRIGGVEQWLHIRGRNRNNPVLLFIHGGPGSAIIGALDGIQRPWEDYFTVVTWDQRQTGKSYYPADDDNAPLTVQQFVEDTEEVIQYLRDYLAKDKLFLLGASWGTTLGMFMVKLHPEWIHAYVGVGQTVSSLKATRAIYERVQGHALEQGEHDLAKKMESLIGQLDSGPSHCEKVVAEHGFLVRRQLSRFAGEAFMHHASFADMSRIFKFNSLISPHLTLTDHSNKILGDDAALSRPPYLLSKDYLRYDLPRDLGSSFEVPVFFFTGRHDWQTPVSLSDAWFEEITAPHKELIHFEESSHFVINEEPGKFVVELVNRVLPFAQAEIDQAKEKQVGG